MHKRNNTISVEIELTESYQVKLRAMSPIRDSLVTKINLPGEPKFSLTAINVYHNDLMMFLTRHYNTAISSIIWSGVQNE